MKLFLMMIISLFLQSKALAFTTVPECWIEENLHIKDATFQVKIDTADLGRQEILELLSEAHAAHLTPARFPEIVGDTISLVVRGQNTGSREFALSRQELKKVVHGELLHFVRSYAAELTCVDDIVVRERTLFQLPKNRHNEPHIRLPRQLPQRFDGIKEFNPDISR